MEFYVAALTDKGVKRQTNQDHLFARKIATKDRTCVFAVLCDGMGGLKHGELASASIVSAFAHWAENKLPTIQGPFLDYMDHIIREEWTKIILSENQKIRSYGLENNCALGSTVTAMLLSEERFFILNIGDTRAYELCNESRQLTEDHTVIADEISLGNMTPSQAEKSPMKNVLTRCVGYFERVYPDMFFGRTKAGAVYMLCSDGFRHCLSPDEMLESLTPRSDDPVSELQQAEMALIETNIQRGEKDNISVIAVYVKP